MFLPAGSLASARSSSQLGTLVRPMPWLVTVQVTFTGRPLPAGLRDDDRRDDEVRVRDRHHVEVVGRLGDVVGLRAVLEDHVAGVGLDEQVIAAGEARRHLDGLRLGVARARRPARRCAGNSARTTALGIGDVVGRRGDDRVGPGARLAGAGADVGDRPGDHRVSRVADRLRGGVDVADGQIGVGGER